MKVLVSAYACEPGKGSEPEVGWQWVRQIARFHETWVITRSNNRENIEKGLRESPIDNLHFIYVDLPEWARFWKKGRRGVHLYYYLWQMAALKTGFMLHRRIHFDIVHHITLINMYMGPWISLLTAPFIWGPVGANPYIPIRFIKLSNYSGLKDNLLRFSARLTRVIDPIISIASYRAKQILVINTDIKTRFSGNIKKKTSILPQNAVHRDIIDYPKQKPHACLKILSAGQLVSIKGFPLALKATAKHIQKNPLSMLRILGDGNYLSELKALADKLHISHSVDFSGQVPRNRVLEIMAQSDVFLFPSFEGAGMVVIEAMAKGLPVVCLDFGGPGEYVTEECGIKVPLSSPNEVIDGLAEGLNRLATDSELYERLSKGAIERVRNHYVWDHIGNHLNTIYEQVMKEP